MGFAFYPLADFLGHIRRRPRTSGLSGIQRLLIATGLLTTLGLPVYLLFLIITGDCRLNGGTGLKSERS